MEPPPEMTRLPPSPSSSLLSLGSDAGQEINEDPKRIIGVRELVKMVKQGRAKPVGTQRREIILNGMPADDGTPPGVSGPPPGYNEENFAKDVAIRGWKIVGGSKGGEKAKVGAYVVYDIVIELQAAGHMNILRRYTDFVNLREQLQASYPHLRKAIPPLPGKAHMSKFSPKFLGERQPRLQRFLRTVILHPQMGAGGGNNVIYRWITSKDLG